MEIKAIISKFNVDGELTAEKQLTCGNINRTYRVTMSDGKRYILQNINVNVFRDPDALMNNIFGVCDFLKKKLPPTADPLRETMTFIKTRDGGHYFKDDDGKYWRMYIYIDAISYQSIEKPGLFYQAAKAFGRFQQLLSDYPPRRSPRRYRTSTTPSNASPTSRKPSTAVRCPTGSKKPKPISTTSCRASRSRISRSTGLPTGRSRSELRIMTPSSIIYLWMRIPDEGDLRN